MPLPPPTGALCLVQLLPTTGRNWRFAQQPLGRIMPLVARLLAT